MTGGGLAPTYSADEVGAHLGVTRGTVWALRVLGDTYGHELHPLRGGLWGSFKAGHKSRRFSAECVEAHKAHVMRLQTDAAFVMRQATRAARLGLEVASMQLDARAVRLMKRARLAACNQAGAVHGVAA